MVFANGAALHGMDAGMLADLGLFHSVTERTDYHSKAPSPLNPFDLFEECVSGRFDWRGTERFAGRDNHFRCSRCLDLWWCFNRQDFFFFFQLSSSSFITIISMLHARFLDSEDLVK